METKANYLSVGIFFLFSLMIGFLSIYWLTSRDDLKNTVPLRFRIPGSASGLSKGSIVSFNGVKIGEVQNVYIDFLNPAAAIADARVNPDVPISLSTRAFIGIASLAGTANIEMKGGTRKEKSILVEAKEKNSIPEMMASPSPVTDLMQTAQDIFHKANNVIIHLEELTHDVRKPLTQTAVAAQRFSESLANNVDSIDRLLTSFSILSKEISGIAGKLDSTMHATERLLNSVDEKKIQSIVSNFDAFSKNIANDSKNFSFVMKDVRTTVNSAHNLLLKTEKTFDKVNGAFSELSTESVKKSIMNFEKLIETSNETANNVSKLALTVSARAQDIDQIITHAYDFSKKTSSISSRLDSVLLKVETLLDSSGSKGLAVELHETLQAYRQAAQTLNEKISTITDGVERFSDRGLRDIQNFINEAGRSLSRIERAVTDFERNPQRILVESPKEIPRYDSRSGR